MKVNISQSSIAKEIGVHKSTVSQELKRNRGKRGYRPKQANDMAINRKKNVKKKFPGALHLKAGDFGYWDIEWKYSAKNTGDVPASFFWGLAEAPESAVERLPDCFVL